jgi:hypothetical protein
MPFPKDRRRSCFREWWGKEFILSMEKGWGQQAVDFFKFSKRSD